MSNPRRAASPGRSAAPTPPFKSSFTGKSKPKKIDVTEVKRRLLPRGLEVMPASWTPWHIPPHPVPIDMEIKRLIDARRRPRLQERGDLRSSGVLCPYWYARSVTITAVGKANEEAAVSTANIKEQVKSIASLIKKVQSIRKKVAELDHVWSIAGVDRGLDRWPQITPQALPQVRGDLARLPARLEYIEEYLTARRRERTNNQGDRWKHAFVGHLGLAWFRLTGSPPTNAGQFNSFVEAAWDSVSDCMPETKWDWTVRQVLSINKGVWDRFDATLIPRKEQGDLLKLVSDLLARRGKRG